MAFVPNSVPCENMQNSLYRVGFHYHKQAERNITMCNTEYMYYHLCNIIAYLQIVT